MRQVLVPLLAVGALTLTPAQSTAQARPAPAKPAASAPAPKPAAPKPRPFAVVAGGYLGGVAGSSTFTAVESGNQYNAIEDHLDGTVSGGLAAGGFIGFRRDLTKTIVASGEFGFGTLNYSGTGVTSSTEFGMDTHSSVSGGMSLTVAGRVGYVLTNVKRLMPYGVFGFIHASNHVEIRDDCAADPCGTAKLTATGSQSPSSVLFGAGAEYPLGKIWLGREWFVRGEWIHFSLSQAQTITGEGFEGTNSLGQFTWDFKTTIPGNVIRVLVSVDVF